MNDLSTPRPDRRIKRTQRLLARALVDLTLERGYESVSIRDITERAEVGYATFFRHYPGKDALLLDALDVFLDELLGLLQGRADADAAEEGRLIFEYVAQHSELCRVLLASPASGVLLRRVRETGLASAMSQYAPRPGSAVPPEIAAHHLVTASMSLIQWWLDHDMPHPPAEMGRIYADLIVRPTRAAAFES
jgi:AcrR family transcriptional regulator